MTVVVCNVVAKVNVRRLDVIHTIFQNNVPIRLLDFEINQQSINVGGQIDKCETY
jgi:hypothetical protein